MVDVDARLWPFAPNWRRPVDVDLEYRTDIIESRSGQEQRRALRKTPRRHIAYGVILDQPEMRVFHQLLTKSQSQSWLLADPVRKVVCPNGASAGSNQIQVDAIPAWLKVDQGVVIGVETLAVVLAINPVSMIVTLDAALDDAVTPGAPMRPALPGRLLGNITARNPSSGVSELNLSFTADPGSETEDAASPTVYIHDGREVLASRPNWGEPVSDEFIWPVEQIDYGFGRVATFNPLEFGAAIRRAAFVAQDAEAAAGLQQFFARRRGQAGEFLMPTWLNDLPPKFDLVAGESTIRIEGRGVFEAYADDLVYRSVALLLRDGRRIFRTVSSIQNVDDDSEISFTQPWLSDIPVADIAMVSWLPVVRFASDQLTLEWLTSEVAQTSLAMRTLKHLPAEAPIPAYDGAAQFILEVWGQGSTDILDRLNILINVDYPEITA